MLTLAIPELTTAFPEFGDDNKLEPDPVIVHGTLVPSGTDPSNEHWATLDSPGLIEFGFVETL